MLARTSKRISAAAAVAGLLGAALVALPGTATAVVPVPPSASGSIEIWGTTGSSIEPDSARASYPTADGPWSAVALGASGTRFAITADGYLARLTEGDDSVLPIPAELVSAKVKAVSTASNTAAAVTEDGAVQVWGTGRGGVTAGIRSPEFLGGKAIDVAVGTTLISVLLDNGKVGMITAGAYRFAEREFDVPIENAVEIAANVNLGLARIRGGGVVAYEASGPLATPPAAVAGDQLDDPVVSIAFGNLAIAVTQAGVVKVWSPDTGEEASPLSAAHPPSSITGKVIDVAASGSYTAALTDTNQVTVWGQLPGVATYDLMTTVPTSVNGHQISDLVGGNGTFAAIMAAPLPDLAETTKSAITGAATVGATLTGTPATFEGSPDSITYRWLANDEAIANAIGTTYMLTAAELGKTITFESTALRGDAKLVSLSAATSAVAAAPYVAAPSTTTVTTAASTYGSAGSVTVTVGNAVGRPVAGTVTLSGAGAVQTAAVTGNTATFAIDKSVAAGSYTLTAAYSGSADLTPSAGTSGYTVNKAKSKKPTFKANKASTSKKKGKATVTVASNSGLAKATGKATVTLKSGKTTKKIKVTLSNGKKSITLPKLKKGKWKVQVAYNGDKNYAAQKSKSYNLKIKK